MLLLLSIVVLGGLLIGFPNYAVGQAPDLPDTIGSRVIPTVQTCA